MDKLRVLAAMVAVAAGAALLSSCGTDNGVSAAEADEIELLGIDAVPSELLGLTVAEEDASSVKNQKRPFVEAVGLYSLRDAEDLQATLQLARFTETAETERASFRQAVVQQVGSTVPHRVQVGDHDVYITTGRRQQVAIWFQDRTLFILSMRDDYPTPRSLTRAALEIDAP